MKIYIFIWCIVHTQIALSQMALQNNGNLQVHDNAEMGFHIDLINNGTFNQNLGLVGFYNTENALSISGIEIPKFYDLEVDVNDNLFLDINVEVENSLAFSSGDVITPRDIPEISLDFLENSIFIFEDDFRHTDGYASFSGDLSFTFPIGDDNTFRPLITTNTTPNTIVKAAYFYDNPNFPSIFNTGFNTASKEPIIQEISEVEFWDFDGSENSIVRLTWNSNSAIDNLVSDLQALRVVGWHIEDKEWKDLGNSGITGNLEEGTIDSYIFNANDYEVLTFGSLLLEEGLIVYQALSPNNDGKNDTFVIKGIEAFNNVLKIYNRWGNKVFEAVNYQNDWNGLANSGRLFKRGEKLPVGTYYFTLELTKSKKLSAGWLYINY